MKNSGLVIVRKQLRQYLEGRESNGSTINSGPGTKRPPQ